MDEVLQQLHAAFCADDAGQVGDWLRRHPEFRARINDPSGPFDSPPIVNARSPEMIDVLLEAGADINAKSRWWAGGFGLLHLAKEDLAAYAIEKGAVIDIHAAARLGRLDRIKQLLADDPALVQARGGDGQTPLHFAASIPIAECLLEKGAEIDARDIDHESTPAQYMTGERHPIARYLVERGCQTDLLMAAALGDSALVSRSLDRDPECIHLRVSDEYFPMIGGRAGGTIYQWTLGWYVSAHDAARKFGHTPVFEQLMGRSPAEVQLLVHCWDGDETRVRAVLARHPNIGTEARPAGRRQIAHAARNNNQAAVHLMLLARLPVDATSQHHATALHWAAWHGNVEMVRDLLAHHAALDRADNDFGSTPVGWAIHGSLHRWDPTSGDPAATVALLLQAGAKPPAKLGGSEAVQAVLRRHGING